MKRMWGALVVVAITLNGSAAMARTLEDILKEKGVITEEDYKEATRSKPLQYKLGEGFTLTSPDGKFSTTIASHMQLRYTLMDLDDSNKPATDYSKFELRRIRLFFNGYAYSKDLTYRLVINFANSQNPGNSYGLLEETYMNYRLLDGLQFRLGQDKVPFGRQFITQSSRQQFVDSAMASLAFVPGIDTGLMVHGRFGNGLVAYNVGGYGGVGQNTFRSSTDNAFAARLTFNPLGDFKYSESDVEYTPRPLVSVGANFYRNTLNGTEPNNLCFAATKGWYKIGNSVQPTTSQLSANEAVDFNTAGVDGAFKWRGFSAQGEYFMAQAKGQTTKHLVRGAGFYAQAGYFVIPGSLEVAARYSYLDPNRDVPNDHWVETTAAVSWYIRKHYLKLQTDYTNIHKQSVITSPKGPNPTDDQQVRVQAQLMF